MSDADESVAFAAGQAAAEAEHAAEEAAEAIEAAEDAQEQADTATDIALSASNTAWDARAEVEQLRQHVDAGFATIADRLDELAAAHAPKDDGNTAPAPEPAEKPAESTADESGDSDAGDAKPKRSYGASWAFGD